MHFVYTYHGYVSAIPERDREREREREREGITNGEIPALNAKESLFSIGLAIAIPLRDSDAFYRGFVLAIELSFPSKMGNSLKFLPRSKVAFFLSASLTLLLYRTECIAVTFSLVRYHVKDIEAISRFETRLRNIRDVTFARAAEKSPSATDLDNEFGEHRFEKPTCDVHCVKTRIVDVYYYLAALVIRIASPKSVFKSCRRPAVRSQNFKIRLISLINSG